MRNPYIVGRWVRGKQHYGRQRLIDYLLHSSDLVIWPVGTRRMGKTSLLRHIEWLLDQGEVQSALVPLFLDLQGTESMDTLAEEIWMAVEDNFSRFEALGVDISQLEDKDPPHQLRILQRALQAKERVLLLLIDEAEAFIHIAERNPTELARLRQVMQNGRQRTIMTATKLLIRLNELTHQWLTSPFLAGVSLVNLWSLDPVSAKALVRQEQNPQPVEADENIVSDVLEYTNRHPYLIQYLCYRLFESRSDGTGYLRPVTDQDLEPDQLLSGFFRIDFSHLSPTERAILLTIARKPLLTLEEIAAEFPDLSTEQVWRFVYGLYKLGFLRKIYEDQWAPGNEFLRRWLRQREPELRRMTESLVSDQEVSVLLGEAQQAELTYLRQQQALLQERLRELLTEQAGYSAQEIPMKLAQEIQQVRRELQEVRRQLDELSRQ